MGERLSAIRRKQQHMSTTSDSENVLTYLQRMDSYEFEHFIANLWERQGWDTSVTQASTDAGIDVVATKETPVSQKVLIQAKRYGPETTVGGPDIQQYNSLKDQENGVDAVIVVTSNRFSHQAQQRARELNVKTVDGSELVDLIERLDAYDLIDIVSSGETDDRTERASASIEPQVDHSAGNETEDSSFSWEDISPDTYLRFIQGGTVAWSIGFVLAMIGYSGGTFGSLIGIAAIVCWLMFPPALYYEAERVSETTDWAPYRTLYSIGGAVPFLNALVGGIYLYHRRQAYQDIRAAESVPDGVIEIDVTTDREKKS